MVVKKLQQLLHVPPYKCATQSSRIKELLPGSTKTVLNLCDVRLQVGAGFEIQPVAQTPFDFATLSEEMPEWRPFVYCRMTGG